MKLKKNEKWAIGIGGVLLTTGLAIALWPKKDGSSNGNGNEGAGGNEGAEGDQGAAGFSNLQYGLPVGGSIVIPEGGRKQAFEGVDGDYSYLTRGFRRPGRTAPRVIPAATRPVIVDNPKPMGERWCQCYDGYKWYVYKCQQGIPAACTGRSN